LPHLRRFAGISGTRLAKWGLWRRFADCSTDYGGNRVDEVLAVIKELGGVKKFKELAEAMTASTLDDIPF